MPGSHKLLSDPGTYIADTRTTVHNTPHRIGIEELRKEGSKDNITVGNGQKVKSMEVGHII